MRATNLTFIDQYWFARGYYDGRATGSENCLEELDNPELRYAYRLGYDTGVSDYCELDMPEEMKDKE